MPTISVNRDELFRRLGKSYTEKEFDELCFEFGIELDEVTTEKQMKAKEVGAKSDVAGAEDVLYRIEIPANRYDLLCMEGLSRALNIFLGRQEIPKYQLSSPAKIEELKVLENTKTIRPYAVAAVIRGIKFTKASYDSFIDLQDKLHQNLCRKRAIVAIGTHDLDTIQGPFIYDAQTPKAIKFVPLKQTKEFDAASLLEHYLTNDDHLKPYVPLIKDSPVYPVIYDSNNVVCSLPPIINGEHSKITLDTTNIFIECTAIDLAKAEVVLDTLVCMFSEYCDFTVEPVRVTQSDGTQSLYPKLNHRQTSIALSYIKSLLGIDVSFEQTQKLLQRMGLSSTKTSSEGELMVEIPPTRHDILHFCDLAEDIGISYGYNNIKLELPQTLTIGKQFALNKVSDQLRFEVSRCGFTEVLTFSLCSRDDIADKMRDKTALGAAVKISNPKTLDFQVARTSLLPGLLKTLASNKKMPIPLKIFEVSDIVTLDAKKDVGARNERFLSALYYNKNSGFEIIHGLLDRIMQVIEIPYVSPKELGGDAVKSKKTGYTIRAKNDPRFLTGRCAEILVNGQVKGIMGVLHPEVICNFDLQLPCSALELSIEDIY